MSRIVRDGWFFDKRINLSNLLTAFMIATSIIWWAAQIEKRIAVLEVELKAYYEGFTHLNSKIDRLVERKS